MMMQRGKKVWIEIPASSHAVIISSIAGWKCIALSWWRAKNLPRTPVFQENWFSQCLTESCLHHDCSGTSWGQQWLHCGAGRVSREDSGSWIPGAETDCTSSTSCTELSQWSNYWKWSVWHLEKCLSFKVTQAASEPCPAPAHDCLHTPTHPQLPPCQGGGGGAALSTEHLHSCKHKSGHQPAGRVLLSAEDGAYHVCDEKQHLLQDFPTRSGREVLINEGHALWCDAVADTFRAARNKTLLGLLKVTGNDFHSSQKRYCTHHEVALSLGWAKMN